MQIEELVEAAARRMAVADGQNPDKLSHNSFEWWRHYVPMARAAIEATLSAAEPVAWQPRYKQEVIDHLRTVSENVSEYAMTVFQTKDQAEEYGHGGHDVRALYAAPPAPSVAVKALEEAFKHFKVVYDPPNGISINEATRAEAIKLASSALCSTLSKVEIETLVACEDWKANFEIMRIRGVDNTAEAWRSSQRVVDNLLDRGLLEFGKPNTTYRITDAGRSALSAQVQDVAEAPPVDSRHRFEPNSKYPWFCAVCGYAPHEPLKHLPAAPAKQGGGE